MTPRHWRILGFVAAALVLVAGWFALVSPARSDAGELRMQAEYQQQQAQQLRSRISLLQKQNEEIPTQQALLAAVQKKLPSTASVPTLIRSLTAAAEEANVTMASLTPERPVAIEAPQTAPPPPEEEDSEASAEDSEAADAAPAAPAQARVQRLPLTITACGSFAEVRRYLGELEQMKRVMAVSRLSISRGACAGSEDESDLTVTVGASVFILPAADTSAASGDAASAAGAAADPNGAS